METTASHRKKSQIQRTGDRSKTKLVQPAAQKIRRSASASCVWESEGRAGKIRVNAYDGLRPWVAKQDAVAFKESVDKLRKEKKLGQRRNGKPDLIRIV